MQRNTKEWGGRELGVGGLCVGQTVLHLHDIHNTGRTHTTYNIRGGIHGREERTQQTTEHGGVAFLDACMHARTRSWAH